MADEQLKLVVEVLTKSAASLTDMQRQVQAMANQWAAANKLAKTGAEDHAKALSKLREEANKLGNDVRGILTPAMTAFGITTLSAAGAVAAITRSVGDFAEHARRLSGVSKITGIPKEAIESYDDAARVIGISAEEMNTGLVHFTRIQDQWHRLGRGPLADFFAQQPKEIRDFGMALRAVKDPLEAAKRAMAFLQDERIPAIQRLQAAEQFGFSAAIVRTSKNVYQLQQLLKEDRQLKPQDWDKVASDWLLAKARLENVWDDLSDHVGHAMAPAFTRMANDLREWIIAHREEIEEFATDVSKWIESINWKELKSDAEAVATVFRNIVADIIPVATAINDVVNATVGWNRVIEAYLALRFANAIGSLLAPLTGIAALGVPPLWVLALLGLAAGYEAGEEIRKNLKEGTGIDPNAADKREPPKRTEKQRKLLDDIRKERDEWIEREKARGFHPSSFSIADGGENPLLAGRGQMFPTEETLGVGPGGASDAIDTIAAGTRKGVYDGMIDFWQYMKGDKSGGGGGLFSNAAFSPSSGGRGPGSLPDLGAVPPFQIGKEALGAGEKPGQFGVADIKSAVTGAAEGTPSGEGSPYLAKQRAQMFAEYDKWSPVQKRTLANIMMMENARSPQDVLESLANRVPGEKGTKLNPHGTLWEGVSRGFYSTFRAAYNAASAGRGNLGMLENATGNVRGGSDVLEGRSDQGMLTDPGHRELVHNPALAAYRRLKKIHGEWYSDKKSMVEFGHAERRRKEAYDAEYRRNAGTAGNKEAGNPHVDIGKLMPGLQFGGIVTKPTVAMIGERGPEAVVPIDPHQLSFIKGLGQGETGFSRKEAYSTYYNQISTNKTMRELKAAGKDPELGADWGFFQTNAGQVADAIKHGMDPDIAKHLHGGGRGGTSSETDQILAMHQYLLMKYPHEYGALQMGGKAVFEEMRSKAAKEWFALSRKERGHSIVGEVAKSQFDTSLTAEARQAGMLDSPGQRITGNASVRIALGQLPHRPELMRPTDVPHHHYRGETAVANQ
jgi:hypothetical protein